jgi:transposase InsO family protein
LQKRPESNRAEKHRDLLENIQQIHKKMKGIYDSPRMALELRDNGILVSRGTVARLMKKNRIYAKTVKNSK